MGSRTKTRRHHRKHGTTKAERGTASAVDVVVGERGRHIGLVSIENNGRDEVGRVVGTNGIKWVTA